MKRKQTILALAILLLCTPAIKLHGLVPKIADTFDKLVGLAKMERNQAKADYERALKETDDPERDQYLKQISIVYDPKYNISFFGDIEKLIHPFDGSKYKTVATGLAQVFYFKFHRPEPISRKDLLLVHTPEYLDRLTTKKQILERITEVPLLRLLPASFLDRKILEPMRYQTGGTLKALELALQTGYGINIGGGFHHAKENRGSGFCVYGDIQLAVLKYLEKEPNGRVLIVDLDAHQGNGYADFLGSRGFIKKGSVRILDIYNKDNFPRDENAKQYVTYNGSLMLPWSWNQLIHNEYRAPCYKPITDEIYLPKLKKLLNKAMQEYKPTLLIYNAGTDIWEGDRLGRFKISAKGIIERDEYVFKTAWEHKAPIVMLTSGGYSSESGKIIAGSLINILIEVLGYSDIRLNIKVGPDHNTIEESIIDKLYEIKNENYKKMKQTNPMMIEIQ